MLSLRKHIQVSGLIILLLSFRLYQAFAAEFTIGADAKETVIEVSAKEAKVVQLAAQMLSDDIYKVNGAVVPVGVRSGKQSIMAGTIGQNKLIDSLANVGLLDISEIEGQWESFKISYLKSPVKGIDEALVVAGSDRRATAYGLLELSRMMGVSPWEWWADVTPDKKEKIILSIGDKVYGSPSVKYRGIFLNDEDWGLQRWAALNYEPETGDIGPKTYAKVFELLLRLRANTIWPAMHSCTKPFYSYPGNKKVADDYAIVVGTSHCEPMLCNINVEWNSKTMGEWRYDNNAQTIKNLFEKRSDETAGFESMYTMGMRGEHDSPMIVGEDNSDGQVKLLEQVIADQRNILIDKTGRAADELPQIFIPYKEVLEYYQKGLQLPEDISLVWTDDNYGYIRRLSNPKEQLRSGGAGIYYHTSYWGRPHDYLWLNSTNPVLMWEEMAKAYAFQSRNLWVLNCGDIKPHEYNIELFLDMAWDMADFEQSKGVKSHMEQWSTREFGEQNATEITSLMYEYYRLAFQRRPEFMSWGQVEPVTKSRPNELTQIHYGDELTLRIHQYQNLINETEKLKNEVAANRKNAFYQLVYYPIVGAAKLNHKWLYAYKNEFTAQQGRASAACFGDKSREAYARIQSETRYFNDELSGGKWKHIMNMAPRNLPVFSEPVVTASLQTSKAQLGLALESYEMEVNHDIINSYADVLPVFNAYTKNEYFVDVFLKGQGQIDWKAVPKADWIALSANQGTLSNQKGNEEQRLWVSIDWSKVPAGEDKKEAPLGHDYQLIPPSYKVNSAVDFISGDSIITIGISAFNPKLKELERFSGFIEDKGFVSIYAENFSRTKRATKATWEIIEGLGYTGSVVRTMPLSVEAITDISEILANSPILEYDFYTFNFGEANVYLQAVPTHAFYEGTGVRCAVAIDDAEPVIVDFQTIGRNETWKQNVLRNASQKSVGQIVNKAGKHTLKIWMVDPGVMIDQILIDLGGWKTSYAFPKETAIND